MKFKVGDRVRIVTPRGSLANHLAGRAAVITEVREDFYGIDISPSFKWFRDEMVLEEVFNSPLYKALNEDK